MPLPNYNVDGPNFLPKIAPIFLTQIARKKVCPEPCTIKLSTAVMEQCTLKNVKNGLSTNIYSYLETSGGQSSNLYLNVAHF